MRAPSAPLRVTQLQLPTAPLPDAGAQVNIAGVMAALDVDELDRTSKQVLVVIACRADRAGGARVSIERIARDCGIAYGTAWRALQRALKAGFVVVDNPGDNH